MPPDLKLGSIFGHTTWTLVDVLHVLRMLNVQLANSGHFLFPAGPAHSTRMPTHLIRVPKGLAPQLPTCNSLRGWATPTLKSCKKTHPLQERFEKIACVPIVCLTTQLWGVAGPKAGHFFRSSLSAP